MRALFCLVVTTLSLAGCGAGADTPGATASEEVELSVAEAIAGNAESSVRVVGYVLEREGEARLCHRILESYPPQCGEPSLRIEGDAPPLSEKRVVVEGTVRGGALITATP